MRILKSMILAAVVALLVGGFTLSDNMVAVFDTKWVGPSSLVHVEKSFSLSTSSARADRRRIVFGEGGLAPRAP
jgi:hypothetical protein